ncbi:MAG: UDP-glucose/GDP-mannose dehydrogenase family protein [Chloroflexi bacterium]|nr:UDP-glucose/GDP-mannose dehydrogenase family protein [Chloroflexota bacterium]
MRVCVIGLGYVGAVAAAAIAESGHQVTGIDVDAEKVRAYRSGSLPIFEPGLQELLQKNIASGRLALLHIDEVEGELGNVVLIATGTPTTESGAADLSQVRSAIEWTIAKQQEPCVIVVKSTIPPGTGVRLWETLLRGTSFEYVSNPEFLREGQAVNDWFHPDRVVIGGRNQGSFEIVKSLYEDIETPFVLTDITSAEMIKYAANAFLATKISFINEIAALSDRLGATIDDIRDGISLDPRIGNGFLHAGVGYGGSCFPKDVRALDYLALTTGHNFELLRSVITVNNRQRMLPFHALKQRFGMLDGLPVGVLGLAFKPNTDDVRDAPSLDLLHLLSEHGAHVKAYDPKARPHALPSSVELMDSLEECVRGTQALVLMTEWSDIINADWESLARMVRSPRFFFDGRNALDKKRMVSLGFEYTGVGRNGRNLD